MNIVFPNSANVIQNQADWISYYFNLFIDPVIIVISLFAGIMFISWIIKAVTKFLKYGFK